MRVRRAATIVAMVGALLTAAPAAQASTSFVTSMTATQPKCEIVSGQRWCVALSTLYPQTTGWYGWVGLGTPCGATPLPNFFYGHVGTCMAQLERVWRYRFGSWRESHLPVGMTVYVHPYTSTWRWVYEPSLGWAAIPADRLLLKYRA